MKKQSKKQARKKVVRANATQKITPSQTTKLGKRKEKSLFALLAHVNLPSSVITAYKKLFPGLSVCTFKKIPKKCPFIIIIAEDVPNPISVARKIPGTHHIVIITKRMLLSPDPRITIIKKSTGFQKQLVRVWKRQHQHQHQQHHFQTVLEKTNISLQTMPSVSVLKKFAFNTHMLQTLLSSTSSGIITITRDGSIVKANKAARELFGVLLGKKLHKLEFESWNKVMGEQKYSIPKAIDHIPFGPLTFSVAITPVDEEYSVVEVHDISSLVALHEDVKHSLRFLSLVENIQDIIFSLDISGNITYFNKVAKDLLGYAVESVIGKSILSLITGDSKLLIKDYLIQLKKFKLTSPSEITTENMEVDMRSKNFDILTFSLNITPQLQDGKVVLLNGIGRNITEKRRIEHEKDAAEQAVKMYLQSVLENVPSAIIVLDDGLNCTYVNKSYSTFFGKEDITGKSLIQFLPIPLISINLGIKIRKAMATRQNVEDIPFSFNNHHYTCAIIVAEQELAAAAAAAAAATTTTIAVILIINDVTEMRRVAKVKLAAAKQQHEITALKEMDTVKTQFLSITSHELKTPITPILMQVQMLEQGMHGTLNPEQQKSVAMIDRNMRHLDQLIGDVLDISRIESKGLKLVLAENDINVLVNDVVNLTQPVAKDSGIIIKALTTSCPSISCDAGRVKQVLRNLINNALQFTKKGSITVSTKKQSTGILVTVTDTGIGIKKEHLAKIFEPFFQVTVSYKRKTRGRGLGLPICKGIIEGHGGEIWVKSTYGKGSSFKFILPYKANIQVVNPFKQSAQQNVQQKARNKPIAKSERIKKK
jgi:PAS domain S-box-containing protein